MKKPIERSERRKNLLKTVAKSSKQRYVLIVRQSLPLQAIDRYSVQRIVAIKQGRIKRKPTEKQKKVITIIVSVYVLCVAVPTGLHTVSRNSAYGRLRKRYLREHKRVLYYTLLTSGKLYEHLVDIDTSACDMAEYLIKEMAIRQGVTEKLKAEDMMGWIGLMNNIQACVDEIVLNDIVYS